ncbi:hypothetical protein PHMEG_00031881 [Phytophthora megakarya]|uniref:Uncharacterized protein n=1 Tax=Phytophthora megakarya TaxID=4795 RepID=A0A225UX94_9STRA|nr:hypothetical protein PHMEG_00031881 [Phytophthora megakarya]
MTKAQRKRAQAKQDSQRARERATLYRQGKTTTFVSFDDVAALLDGPYSYYYSKPMVDALVIPCVEVRGELFVKTFSVGQDVPKITKIPQLPAVVAMLSLIEGRSRFILVMKTSKGIDEVEWLVSDIRKPFARHKSIFTKSSPNLHQMYTKSNNFLVFRANTRATWRRST